MEGADAIHLLTAADRVGHFQVGLRPGSRVVGEPVRGIAAERTPSATAGRFIRVGEKNGANTA
jgi:hypothetical protein